MDFGHINIQRIAKSFTSNTPNAIDDPCITVWNKTTLTILKQKKPEYYNIICSVIDRMGEASANVCCTKENKINLKTRYSPKYFRMLLQPHLRFSSTTTTYIYIARK